MTNPNSTHGVPGAPTPEPVGYVHPQLLRELRQGKTLSIPLVHPTEADLEPGGDVPVYAAPAGVEGRKP